MSKANDILGMNARNQRYVSLNSATAKSIANSKVATNILMRQHNLSTPQQHAMFLLPEDVTTYDWSNLEGNFVVKPTSGLAGKGVVVFRKKVPGELAWLDAIGKKWELEDIQLHCMDILEGQYSAFGEQNIVILQERIPVTKALQKYVFKGTPDIRVIVFNQVPVMAMVRLPTKESEGRANVHQGALAVGIDIASGYTTSACTGKGSLITYVPGTKHKLRGFKIPQWRLCLLTAVKAAQAAQLAYCGIDLFLHNDKGPMVVELNARPGLQIQIANKAGLRRRLERVEDLTVLNPEHGVKIGQALFASPFTTKLKLTEDQVVISTRELIHVYDSNKKLHTANVLINTGRTRSAIAESLVKDLRLINPDNLLWFQQEKKEGLAPVVEVELIIKHKRVKAAMVVSKRLNKTTHQIELGRKDIAGFLISAE